MSRRLWLGVAMWALPALAAAQPPAMPLTLDQALSYAVEHHPGLAAAREDSNERAAGVSVAEASAWPRFDAIWQSNAATVNNVFGQLLPQSIVPPISGPVLVSASGTGVWSSAAGGLLTWEPIDLGSRGASIRVAETSAQRARATEALTRLELQQRAASRFLQAAAAALAVDVAEADAARREVLVGAVRALVDNQLRPGAELSRAEAERAAASTRLIQAREAAQLARIALARAIGFDGDIRIDARGVTDRVAAPPPPGGAASHPLTLLQNASVDFARAKSDEVRTLLRPHVLFQASVSARGSGAEVTGEHDTGLGGLALDRANWAGGVQIVFPNLFDWHAQHARASSAEAAIRAAAARRDDAALELNAEQRIAAARLAAARAIAANTPIQLAAAQQTESQSRARYDAGLANVIEIAEAQNLLAASEYEDRVARIKTWQALLDRAVAQGDLVDFLGAVRGAAAP